VKALSVIVWVDEQGIAKARDSTIGGIIAESSDHASVIQAAVDSVGPVGGTIFIKKGLYTIKRPITFSDEMRVVIRGELSRGPYLATTLRVDSTFPDSRYLFEYTQQSTSKLDAVIDIEDLHAWNPNWSTTRAGLAYWSGFQQSNFTGLRVRRVFAHNLWRGILISGRAYYWLVEDFYFDVTRTDMTADAAIITVGVDADNIPTWGWVYRVVVHVLGSASNAIRMDASSSYVRDVVILGGTPAGKGDNFSDAVIRLGQNVGAWTNYLDGIHISDVSAGQTALILDGVSASNPLTRNNRIVFTSMVAKYVRFRNSAYNNTVIVRRSPDGVPTIDDAEAGPGNTVIVEPGSRLWSQSEAGKIAAAKCRVIDLRPRTSATGAATIPAGSTSVTVTHGLLAAPSRVLVTPTANIGAVWVESITSTSFTIRCSTAPATSTTVYWYAEL
jgi:hypothetical protein